MVAILPQRQAVHQHPTLLHHGRDDRGGHAASGLFRSRDRQQPAKHDESCRDVDQVRSPEPLVVHHALRHLLLGRRRLTRQDLAVKFYTRRTRSLAADGGWGAPWARSVRLEQPSVFSLSGDENENSVRNPSAVASSAGYQSQRRQPADQQILTAAEQRKRQQTLESSRSHRVGQHKLHTITRLSMRTDFQLRLNPGKRKRFVDFAGSSKDTQVSKSGAKGLEPLTATLPRP